MAGCTQLYIPAIDEIEDYSEHDELRKLLNATDRQTTSDGVALYNSTAASGGYLDAQGIWHAPQGSKNLTGYDPMA